MSLMFTGNVSLISYSARSAAINVNVSSISLLCTPLEYNTALTSSAAEERGVILNLPFLCISSAAMTLECLTSDFLSPKRKSDSTITCCPDSEAILQPFSAYACQMESHPWFCPVSQQGLREPASSGCLRRMERGRTFGLSPP